MGRITRCYWILRSLLAIRITVSYSHFMRDTSSTPSSFRGFNVPCPFDLHLSPSWLEYRNDLWLIERAPTRYLWWPATFTYLVFLRTRSKTTSHCGVLFASQVRLYSVLTLLQLSRLIIQSETTDSTSIDCWLFTIASLGRLHKKRLQNELLVLQGAFYIYKYCEISASRNFFDCPQKEVG